MTNAKKIPVECYSRVVGYFRPVAQWNNGKKEEFFERKTFSTEFIDFSLKKEEKLVS